MGHISGDHLDKEDDLHCGLWGGSFMGPYPATCATCLIKLDPGATIRGKFGEGKLVPCTFRDH